MRVRRESWARALTFAQYLDWKGLLCRPGKIACFMAKRNKQSLISFHNGSVKGIVNFYCWYAMHDFHFPHLCSHCLVYNAKLTIQISAFVNIFSETSLEKLSQLNGLLNNGNRGRNLRHVRKHLSHPAVPLRWLARKCFFWPVRSTQFISFWNWFGKSKCPGAHLNLTINFHHKHSIIPTSCPCVSEDVAAFA